MSEFNEDQVLKQLMATLTDKSMTSEDLEDYADLFESDDELRLFAYGMHVATARNGFRDLLLAMLKAGIPLEILLYAQTHLWLKRTEILDPDFDAEMVANWLNQGMSLVQVLYAASVDALKAEREKDPSLGQKGYAPELEDMYAQWQEHMVFLQEGGRLEDIDQQKVIELTQYCQAHLENLEHNFVQEAKLQLTDQDLHAIWTDLLMQTYNFAFTPNPDTYFYMTTYWMSHIYHHIKGYVLDLMVKFKGNEALLSIENRPYLKAMTARMGDIRELVNSGQLDPNQIDDMSEEEVLELLQTLGIELEL